MKHGSRWLRTLGMVVIALALGACASGSSRLRPPELGPVPTVLKVHTAWQHQVGRVDFPLAVAVNGSLLTLADSRGVVSALDARSGAQVWRAELNASLSAGVGSDGRYAAVVTRDNQLVMLQAGSERWRAVLGAEVFTAPLVAGERVFVLAADRSVAAYDAASGRQLWRVQRSGEALVLRQGGVLMAVGNTLVVGLSGRLVGLNPLSGAVLWDVAIATPRGTNDVERLVDLVAGVARDGDEVCVRAFQAAVGCVDAARGTLRWRHAADGSVGVAGDDQQVYGVEEDGRVQAWRLSDGGASWRVDTLRLRQLSSPLVIGRSIALGDGNGWVHLLSRADGSALARLATDGSAIVAAPVQAAGTLVVVTRNGGVFGFQPD